MVYRTRLKGCFDNIDHRVLLSIIRQQITDERFLTLLKGMLKAGYMDNFRYNKTLKWYSPPLFGTFWCQKGGGGVISPILSNILLNELDKFVSNELIPQYTKGKKRKLNSKYVALTYQMTKAKKAKNIKRYKKLEKERRLIPSVKTDDKGFIRIYYIRYADDFLLGIAGPPDFIEIKEKIRKFLQNLKLT